MFFSMLSYSEEYEYEYLINLIQIITFTHHYFIKNIL